MTKSIITDERITSVIERLEHFASNLKWTDVRGAQDLLTAADGLRELQERRKAAMDCEPVIADCDPEVYEKGASACLVAIPKETAEVICKGISAVTGCKIDWHYIGGRVNIKALRLSPQPAPVVTFYRDGIEAAAKWLDQQREAYDSEHGWSDPDTGTFEFGNDAQRDYSSTLEELAEGIRALHPNAGMQPAPEVPDSREQFEAWAKKQGLMSESFGIRSVNEQFVNSCWEAWQESRAAMLQAQSLHAVKTAPALGSLQKTGEVLHTNSPVIPDTWIPVSERMPIPGVDVLVAKEFFGPGDWRRKIGHVRHEDSGWNIYGASWTPTHWMPLPAAPQEVKP